MSTNEITFETFIRMASNVHLAPEQRSGQYAMNVLSQVRPEIAREIIDASVSGERLEDPFHDDSLLPVFYARVAELWDGPTQWGGASTAE